MDTTEIITAVETMSEQGGTKLILEEVLRALPTDYAEEILRFIATNWDYDVPELFDEDEDEDEGEQNMYAVYFVGEYDLDDNGNVIPLVKYYTNGDEAFAAAQEWQRNTGYIANIEHIE